MAKIKFEKEMSELQLTLINNASELSDEVTLKVDDEGLGILYKEEYVAYLDKEITKTQLKKDIKIAFNKLRTLEEILTILENEEME